MFEVEKKKSILYWMSFLYHYLGMKTIFIFLLSLGLSYAEDEDYGIKQVTTCNCGWLNRRNFEMIEGDKSGKNKYPMLASIRDLKYNKPICSGVILTPQHILTLSCFVSAYKKCDSKDDCKLEQIGVYVGQSKFKPEELCLLYDVEEIKINGNFALLVLKEKLRFTRLTGPACTPNSDTSLNDQISAYVGKHPEYNASDLSEGKLVGWELEGPDYRRSHHVPVSIKECPDSNEKPPKRNYCLETFEGYNFRDGNSCMKQPGSPLLWFDNEIFRYTVVGLLENPGDCNHVRVFKLNNVAIRWLESELKDTDYKICVKQDFNYGDFIDEKN